MACRSCPRQLLQLSRQTQPLFDTQSTATAATIVRHSIHRQVSATTLAPQNQQQRRGLRTTPARPKSWIPESVRNLGGQLLRSTAEPYQVLHATESIYKTCAKAADYKISETDKRNGTVPKTPEGEELGVGETTWHNEFNLPPTFSTWSQVTMLHLYLVFARMRDLPLQGSRAWQRQLIDHYFFDAEARMDLTHGITSRAMRHRYLKDLFVQWRGLIVAYDEGVARGDAALAAAVWRNVYKAREDVDPRHLAAIVSWMRMCLKTLDEMPDEGLFFQAATIFSWPIKNELMLVDRPVRELESVLGSLSDPGEDASTAAKSQKTLAKGLKSASASA
ncbi:ubiquinol-cytochrome C chaperone-domain-containing protein [Xylariales sp. PMI_506]|nr:ubiquinol-cytochrome C chaperone-domain-containing protein [Xylariales sp. PMI_506]